MTKDSIENNSMENNSIDNISSNHNGRPGAQALAWFRNLVNQAPVAMMLVNIKGFKVVFANSYYLELSGKTADIIGGSLFDYLPVAYGKIVKEKFETAIRTREPYKGNEVPVTYQKNGAPYSGFYNVVYQPVLEARNEINGIMVVVTEVTEQVVARQKLKAIGQTYNDMINSSPSAIGVLKGEKLVIFAANDPLLAILGKGRDIIGKPYFEVMPELVGQGYPEIFEKVYSTGQPFYAVETPVTIVRDGKPELQYYNFVLHAQRNGDGVIEGVGVMATEVTGQALSNAHTRASEKHFRLLADLMPAKISNATASGEVIYFNKQWLEFSGMNFEDLRDFGYHQIIHPDEVADFQAGLKHAAATGTVHESEMRFRNKDGIYKWHRNIAAPIKDEQGSVRMWVGVTTEIQQHRDERELLEKAVVQRTRELQSANSQLKDSNEELVQVNKKLESFVYVSSHDLQEPLRKIQTFSGLLLQKDYDVLSDNGKRYFNRVKEAAARMQTLIEDLLVYSKAGNEQRHLEMHNLGEIVALVQTDLDHLIVEKNAVIESSNLCDIPVDPSQFRQLLHNLVGNALKFSFPGRASHIIISSTIVDHHPSSPGKKFCHLSISDNGIGFEPEYSEKIFEVFQRLHSKNEFEGTGIGLAIVKKIVEHHNGFVEATGKPGEGAVFDIWLPIG